MFLFLVGRCFLFFLREFIVNASVRGVFKDFVKNGSCLTGRQMKESSSRGYVKELC
jgi:hypothetical protein